MYHTFFQWGSSQEARAQVIQAGLLDPTPDVSIAITEAEATGRGKYPENVHTLLKLNRALYFRFF